MSVDAKTLKALQLAVVKGNASKVAQHLKGLDLSSVPHDAPPPSLLGDALSRGDAAIATMLLERGAKPAAGEGATLLVAAFKAGATQLVEPLIASLGDAASVEVGRHVREWTPLMHATKVGDVGAMKSLIGAKADVNARMTRQRGTALMVAAQTTQVAAARALLAAGADVELADDQGWRALQWAAQIGPVEMVHCLVELGASVASPEGASSAMMVAVENGHLGAADALLAARADPDATDAQGWTALTIAAAAGHTRLVGRLLEGGARAAARTEPSGRTPVMAAAQGGHLAALDLLLADDACDAAAADATDEQGVSALMYAAKNGHSEAVRKLLEARCDPHAAPAAAGAAGLSPIELAARKGSAETLRLLLHARGGGSGGGGGGGGGGVAVPPRCRSRARSASRPRAGTRRA